MKTQDEIDKGRREMAEEIVRAQNLTTLDDAKESSDSPSRTAIFIRENALLLVCGAFAVILIGLALVEPFLPGVAR